MSNYNIQEDLNLQILTDHMSFGEKGGIIPTHSSISSFITAKWSKALEEEFTFESRFGDKIEVFKRAGTQVLIPRGANQSWTLDQRDPGIPVEFKSSFKSQKPEQPTVIARSVELLKNDEQFVLCAPTGFGKTYIGTEIAQLMGRRYCVITTKEDILEQWITATKNTLGLSNLEIGVWRGDLVPKKEHKVVISLVQSVAKGPERYGEEAYKGFGLILCDEVHRMGSDQFSQAMWHFPSKYRMGLSATPERRDGKDQVFYWHIGPVKVRAKMEVLIPKVVFHHTGWKVPRNSNGTQIPHDFGRITLLHKPMVRNQSRNAIVAKYMKACYQKNRSVAVFSDTLEHLDILAFVAHSEGIPEDQVGYYVGLPNEIYGKHTKKQQKLIRDQHAVRRILLATYAMMKEGTDLPWLDTCILTTPKSNVEQIVGRIRREYENKHPPVVIDLADDDSEVLEAYGDARLKWYHSLGCEVVQIDQQT